MGRLGIRVIDRYIAKEVLVPFLISIFVFTGVLFLARSLKLIDLVISKNVPASDIIFLFALIVPRFLEIAVPMSLFLGVLVGIGRLSSDSELVVLKSVGLGLFRLSYPVFFIGIVGALFTFSIGMWVRPWANSQLSRAMFELAKNQTGASLVQGSFNDLGQLMLYAERIEDGGAKLENVLISDRRDEETNRIFVAKYGKLRSDSQEQRLELELYSGSIQEGAGHEISVTRYDTNSIALPHNELLDDSQTIRGKRGNEMYMSELEDAISKISVDNTFQTSKKDLKRFGGLLVERQQRFALPFACICVTLVAIALGIQPSRGGHTWSTGVTISIGIFGLLLYYLLMAFFSALAEQLLIPPVLGAWLPNLLYLGAGIYLFRKVESEKWMAVSQEIGDRLMIVLQKLRLV